ncbi:alpha-N-acetylglucosaminidase [Dickeya sp. DW 0440]|uniref:fibronectin type III domain-containing protein n=2 Tax=unclassified Dickeya TaxID=2622466 RepID=UPI0003AB33C0|nr:alpha-N-acetylglucosaminidase [Dickeya sp. DW 0440]
MNTLVTRVCLDNNGSSCYKNAPGHRPSRHRLRALLASVLLSLCNMAAQADETAVKTCTGSLATPTPSHVDSADQDLPYPKINGLYQRPAQTGVTLVGANDGIANKYVEPIKRAQEGDYLLLHAGEHLTLAGQGYFLLRWDFAYYNHGGTLLAENAPLLTLAQGQVKRVALTDRYAPDYPLDGIPGRSGIWNAGLQISTAQPMVPFSVGQPAGNGEVMPTLWRNEIFYLDGTVTLTQREGDVDYNLAITPLTLAEVNQQLADTRHRASAQRLRNGISLDPYTGEAEPPASPDALSAAVTSGSVVQLDWLDCSDNERGFIVEYSYAGHFEEGADGTVAKDYAAGEAYTSAESLPPGSTSIEIGTLAPATTYAFRVKAYNQAGDSAYSNVVSVTTLPAQAPDEAWKTQDIGKPAHAGKSHEENGVLTLEAQNGEMWSAEDNTYFVYQTLKGDGSLTARLIDLRYSAPDAKTGIMMRSALSANSAYVLSGYTAAAGAMSQWRSRDGSATGSKGRFAKSDDGSQPLWLRLTRDGNAFISQVSYDGVNWSLLNKQINQNMPDTLYVGLTLSSHSGSAPHGISGIVSFDNVSIKR